MSRLVHRYESYKEMEYPNYRGEPYTQKKVFYVHCENGEYKVKLCIVYSKYDARIDKYIKFDAISFLLPIDEVTQNSKCFNEALPKHWLYTEKQNSFYETDPIELDNIVSVIESDCRS